jgi:hypothetical protein
MNNQENIPVQPSPHPIPEPQMEPMPFESVFVGNFIFYFGVVAGQRDREIHGHCVSLFSQNRGDHEYGDLISSWQGRSFLIEFKRDAQSIPTELQKPHRAALLKDLRLEEGARMFSARGHFVGYGVAGNGSADSNFMPYHRVGEGATEDSEICGIKAFLERKLMAEGEGWTPRDLQRYLVALKQYANSSAPAGGAGRLHVNGSDVGQDIYSLAVNYDPVSKHIKLAPVDLSRTRELRQELELPRRDRDRSRGGRGGRGDGGPSL